MANQCTAEILGSDRQKFWGSRRSDLVNWVARPNEGPVKLT